MKGQPAVAVWVCTCELVPWPHYTKPPQAKAWLITTVPPPYTQPVASTFPFPPRSSTNQYLYTVLHHVAQPDLADSGSR